MLRWTWYTCSPAALVTHRINLVLRGRGDRRDALIEETMLNSCVVAYMDIGWNGVIGSRAKRTVRTY